MKMEVVIAELSGVYSGQKEAMWTELREAMWRAHRKSIIYAQVS